MEIETKTPEALDLEMLDARLRVVTDGSALAERLRGELARFVVPGGRPQRIVEVRFEPPPPRAQVDGHVIALDDEDAEEQAYGLVFRAALDLTERFVVLHAAALERDGRALLIAGPSESGKTTLTLALLRRGYRLLSDDFTPLERTSGRVHPFLKALGVRPGPGRALARLAGEAVAREAVDPHVIARDAIAAAPAAPLAVALFDGGEAPPQASAPYHFGVRTAGEPSRVAEVLGRIEGARIERIDRAGLVLAIDPGRQAALALAEALARIDDLVLEYGLMPRSYERRATPPRLTPLRASDALILLARDVQNRRPQGALFRSLGGNAGRLMVELARHLGRARFAWLVAGRPEETATALDAWFC